MSISFSERSRFFPRPCPTWAPIFSTAASSGLGGVERQLHRGEAAAVAEFLLDRERELDRAALVEAPPHDEPVHHRPRGERPRRGDEHELEQRRALFRRATRVRALEEGQRRRDLDVLLEVDGRLGSRRHEEGHEAPEGGRARDERAVASGEDGHRPDLVTDGRRGVTFVRVVPQLGGAARSHGPEADRPPHGIEQVVVVHQHRAPVLIENAPASRTSTALGESAPLPTTKEKVITPAVSVAICTAVPVGTVVCPAGTTPPSVASVGPQRIVSGIPVSTRSPPHSAANALTPGASRTP